MDVCILDRLLNINFTKEQLCGKALKYNTGTLNTDEMKYPVKQIPTLPPSNSPPQHTALPLLTQ